MNFGDDGDRSSAWLVHGERPVYENYWATINTADVPTLDGSRFEHHKVYLPPAAIVVMVDDQGRVFMIWRHRFVSDTWGWELPGAVVDDGEEPAETVAREAVEETGYRITGPLDYVATYQPMNGTVERPHHIFVAHGAERAGEPSERNEGHHAVWVPLDQINSLIQRGLISSSGTLIAVLHLVAISSTPQIGTATPSS
ncbi:NUDIX hydrolase [Streptomyces sp. NPDC006530]|uniref:NUDIX hydrolase n=1 Tax=Streptomyces sp. NPDC006530 TaxID=3364750 RepID=UPI0036C07476